MCIVVGWTCLSGLPDLTFGNCGYNVSLTDYGFDYCLAFTQVAGNRLGIHIIDTLPQPVFAGFPACWPSTNQSVGPGFPASL
jgi:hypothetical protein